jgi:predicted TIM-barrel fold metal-dependent hydrolase
MTGNPDGSLTIDAHHHILPDFFWQATGNTHAPIGGLAPLPWSQEASISLMDDAGVDTAVVSLSTPGVHTGDSAKARTLARRCNEFSADLVRSRPDRFGGFACLPLPDVDAPDEMGFVPGGERRGAVADMFRRMYWDTALAARGGAHVGPAHRSRGRRLRARRHGLWS